jgi:enoyl-[acyl-carrier protein] reductase I
MAGRRGLIMGVANDHSIAWGIASALARHGAELAFTYQNENLRKRVGPLAESVGSDLVLPCDVSDSDSVANVFSEMGRKWDGIDFVLHAVAYSDKSELQGRYLDTTRDNFLNTMHISCFSFTEVARLARPMLREGGSLLTLTYLGAEKVMPNYNVMGVAKAALEASVRYLSVDLGKNGVRVNALSAGPMRTLAGSAIADARYVYKKTAERSPIRRAVTLDEVGNSGFYLLSPLSSGVTGETLYVDCGFNVVGMAKPDRSPE